MFTRKPCLHHEAFLNQSLLFLTMTIVNVHMFLKIPLSSSSYTENVNSCFFNNMYMKSKFNNGHRIAAGVDRLFWQNQ